MSIKCHYNVISEKAHHFNIADVNNVKNSHFLNLFSQITKRYSCSQLRSQTNNAS